MRILHISREQNFTLLKIKEQWFLTAPDPIPYTDLDPARYYKPVYQQNVQTEDKSRAVNETVSSNHFNQ